MRITAKICRLLSLLLGTLLLGSAIAEEGKARPRCNECGMYSDASSTRVQAKLLNKGKTESREFCCVGCLHKAMTASNNKLTLSMLSILDYSSFGSKTPKMIDGLKAFYLFGTKPLRGSMLPSVAAFATKDSAVKAKADLGGELLEGWDSVREKLAEEDKVEKVASKEAQEPAELVYVCPCEGDCCADVVSDKPGECPKCGMQLVLKDDSTGTES